MDLLVDGLLVRHYRRGMLGASLAGLDTWRFGGFGVGHFVPIRIPCSFFRSAERGTGENGLSAKKSSVPSLKFRWLQRLPQPAPPNQIKPSHETQQGPHSNQIKSKAFRIVGCFLLAFAAFRWLEPDAKVIPRPLLSQDPGPGAVERRGLGVLRPCGRLRQGATRARHKRSARATSAARASRVEGEGRGGGWRLVAGELWLGRGGGGLRWGGWWGGGWVGGVGGFPTDGQPTSTKRTLVFFYQGLVAWVCWLVTFFVCSFGGLCFG